MIIIANVNKGDESISNYFYSERNIIELKELNF